MRICLHHPGFQVGEPLLTQHPGQYFRPQTSWFFGPFFENINEFQTLFITLAQTPTHFPALADGLDEELVDRHGRQNYGYQNQGENCRVPEISVGNGKHGSPGPF